MWMCVLVCVRARTRTRTRSWFQRIERTYPPPSLLPPLCLSLTHTHSSASAGMLQNALPTHLETEETFVLDDEEEEEEEEGGEGEEGEGRRREEGTAPGEEPKFTNYRDIFQGTLDYIFFRHNAVLAV